MESNCIYSIEESSHVLHLTGFSHF